MRQKVTNLQSTEFRDTASTLCSYQNKGQEGTGTLPTPPNITKKYCSV